MNKNNIKSFYRDLIDALSLEYPRLLEDNIGLYKVFHTFEDKLPLLEVLIEKNLLVGATLKRSSSETQTDIATKMHTMLCENEIIVGQARATYSNAFLELPEIAKNREFIIGDHGGYYAPIIQHIIHNYGEKFLGMTEHTLNGEERLFQYAAQNSEHVPYLSTARVDLKSRSDKEIALAISDEIIGKINASGHKDLMSPHSKEIILLIGYGTMGMNAAHRLKDMGVNAEIIVVDSSFKKMAFATQDGFQCVTRSFEELLPFADLIIMATNVIKGEPPVLKPKHFALLKEDVCLTSMTSMDDEIRQDQLIHAGIIRPRAIDSCYGMYKGPNGNKFSLFLDGKPANVDLSDGGASESICMVEAAGIAGAFKIAEDGYDARLEELDKEIISSLWLKHFHEDFHVKRLAKEAVFKERREALAA